MKRWSGWIGVGVLLMAACHRPHASELGAVGTTSAPDRQLDALVKAANGFLASLDDVERKKATFAFDSPRKKIWSNFPVGMVPRNGVRWGDLQGAKREAALSLLGVALSKPGLSKVRAIMAGDEQLKGTERNPPFGPHGPGGRGPPRDGGPDDRGPPPGFAPPGPGPGGPHSPMFGQDEYYLAIFGAPSRTQPWMLQFGGHHLALNMTITPRGSVLTPSLPAAQPASYQLDGQTVRPLGQESDKSLALVNALQAAQRQKAILGYQVSDLVLGPGQDGKTVAPEGIAAAELTAAQQEQLLDLAHEWVGIINDTAAGEKMAELRAHLAETFFAWSGPTTPGSPSYFRIQGPTVFIEYSPQRKFDEEGLDVQHIHTIYRDPTNDYGARFARP